MKYKNIPSAMHNFGDSFLSLMNYVDDDYVIDELVNIHRKGYDIEVDWKTGTFAPYQMRSPRIAESVNIYRARLPKHMASHGVEIERLVMLKLVWLANQRNYMEATDDRNKDYKIYCSRS